jgi:hypothetical protein
LASEADLLETLRYEVLGHFGLKTFPATINRIFSTIKAFSDHPKANFYKLHAWRCDDELQAVWVSSAGSKR